MPHAHAEITFVSLIVMCTRHKPIGTPSILHSSST
jgi:hypothetical protein